MRLSFAIFTAFSASVFAAPLAARTDVGLAKRQSVFSTKTYDEISISGGVAGNAEQEALDALSGLNFNNLASATQDDIAFLDSVNKICNEAEKNAFNVAIDNASGEEAEALQRGKIKNKVLKLEATMMRLMIDQAQGRDVAEKIEAESAKLNNNIQQDRDEAGKESTFLSFDASTS
ncbi:hypothetical protein DL764_001347 [Monosporascus ibericus]|uniref:Small secreted protein n=1 Tax=Monosporascus ibericus TaxID=155417 RepID=A0A4Q4TUP4_9PEZI|nr:hypothetical protein DL764_001347 [Monosporascus ibericus]